MSKPPIILYRLPVKHINEGASIPVDIDYFLQDGGEPLKRALAAVNGLTMEELEYLDDLSTPPHDPYHKNLYSAFEQFTLAIHKKSPADYRAIAADGYITLKELADYAKKHQFTDKYLKEVDDSMFAGTESYSVAQKQPLFGGEVGLQRIELYPGETVRNLPAELKETGHGLPPKQKQPSGNLGKM